MRPITSYRFKSLVITTVLLFIVLCRLPIAAEVQYATGELKEYERKSLFIFPINYNQDINSRILTPERLDFVAHQLHKMFVNDFRRISFYGIKLKDSFDTFLEDADGFIHTNAREISALRMTVNETFKEAMVTAEDLKKTIENSYAVVPCIDSVEKKIVKGKKSTSTIYNMYIHFDIYKTKTKEKIATLNINNKRNILGALASVTGGYQVDNSDLAGLPKNVRKDEISFRDALAGLFTVLKKDMKSMPEFRIVGTLSMVSGAKFGFNMGNDTGIKIDHRYRTYVTKANGRSKLTGFGKIRKVEEAYCEAQTLIGKPQEGDQVREDPKVGINVVGGFGVAPLQIGSEEDDFVAGSHMCVFLGVEYELGPIFGMSETYTTFNLRMGLPKPEKLYDDFIDVSQIFLNLGITKKIYWKRLALNIGGEIGIHSASLRLKSSYYDIEWEEMKGSGFGFSLHGGMEILITPSISAYGILQLDFYPNPSKLTDEDDYEHTLEDDANWNAKGIGLNFGIKVTL
ncbi:MAG: hypothetical protein GY757_49260 [bacterium]|nr:hypothetical protein [bacterium]